MQKTALKSLKFLILSVFFSAGFSACGFWQSSGNSNDLQDAEIITETSSDIPFATKEPENFQAEIVAASFGNGGKSVQKYLIARKGESFLQKFSAGSENERAILRTKENKLFLINQKSKTFREISNENSDVFSDEGLIKNLTSKWLNKKTSVRFEKAETEKNLTKYRVRIENAENSEILIFVDENLKIPVRQEFYSITADGKKNLTYSIEIKNFKPKAEEKLFELPENLRKLDE